MVGLPSFPGRHAGCNAAAVAIPFRPLERVSTLLADLVAGALDLIFAPVCAACAGPVPTAAVERGVCAACWAKCRPIPLPRCERCWSPLRELGVAEPSACGLCSELRPAVRSIRSAYLQQGPAKEIVHALKYRGWHTLAKSMAKRMAALPLPAEAAEEVRIVIPVPVSQARLRERGYNQAGKLAAELARLRGWQSRADLLLRDRSTGTQTALHRTERRANVLGAFRVPRERAGELTAEHVLLVDDVWTTGATALACADVLLDAGARAVSVITFGRALPELEKHAQRLELLVLN